MVNPGFLQSDRVIQWLGGIEPLWTHLDFTSLCRLRHKPDDTDRALAIAADLTPGEALASPFVANMAVLLRMAEARGGIKLTTSSNLTRAVVAELAETCTWPTFDLDLVRSLNKVLNEADVWPLELLHRVAIEGRLLRRQGRALVLAPNGRKALQEGGDGGLLKQLFELVFWRVNLGYWDGYPVSTWPQGDMGVILWCLGHATQQWETPSKLVRLSTIPVNGVRDAVDDFSGKAFELRILRFLTFFGLLDAQQDPASTDRFLPLRRYRKTALFDRVLSFDVALEPIEGTRH